MSDLTKMIRRGNAADATEIERFNGNVAARILAIHKPQHKGMKPRCPACGLKIRGPHHDDGDDHKRRSGKAVQ